MTLGHLEFLGACKEVSGSRSLLTIKTEKGTEKYLIDCGIFQGPPESRAKNWEAFPVHPSSLDAVFLTHAHLDHSGYIPKLVKDGFSGPIYCSNGTRDLCEVLLMDSARLAAEDAEYANKTGHSRHKPAQALYDEDDVGRALKLFKPLPRQSFVEISPAVSVRLQRSGHIIGSSFLNFEIRQKDHSKRVLFSGDLGHPHSKILRSPENIDHCDLLILESTYGGRADSMRNKVEQTFAEIYKACMKRSGVLMIPSFAVGRSQELLYLIADLERKSLIPVHPVLLDSPMASRATEVFLKHSEDHCFDKAFMEDSTALFPTDFHACMSPDESMLACMRDGPMTVIAGAGMLAGGRILHHLKKRVGDPRHHILIVGHQAEGSKGRYLVEAAGQPEATLRLHHKEYELEAELSVLDGLSAHADQSETLEWLGAFKQRPKEIYLNHGQPEASKALREAIKARFPDMSVEQAELDKSYEF